MALVQVPAPFLPELLLCTAGALELESLLHAQLIQPNESPAQSKTYRCVCGTFVDAELLLRARLDPQLQRRLKRFELNFLVDARLARLTQLRQWLGRSASAGSPRFSAVPVHARPTLLGLLIRMQESSGQLLACVGGSSLLLKQLEERLKLEHPALRFLAVPVASELWGVENDRLLRQLRAQAPALVLVALGAGLQEAWMQAHADLLPVRLMLGVGTLETLLASFSSEP